MDIDYGEIGTRIRAERKAQSLSQASLAEMVGISVTHISHIETGNTKLSLPVLVNIAAALKISADKLLYDSTIASRTIRQNSIAEVLDTCDEYQTRVISDLVIAVKASLDKNRE